MQFRVVRKIDGLFSMKQELITRARGTLLISGYGTMFTQIYSMGEIHFYSMGISN